MSEEERQAVQYFLDWCKQGGITQWVEHFLNAGDEATLKKIKDIFERIKAIFGFQ